MSVTDTERNDQERLEEASQWWLRLQECADADQTVEWLEWVQQHPGNLDAFNRIESMTFGLKSLDANRRAQMLDEFAGGEGSRQQVETASMARDQLTALPRRSFWSAGRYLAAAATICFCAVVGYFFAGGNEPGRVARDATTYRTGHALHQDVTLADGSQVTIGAASTLAVRLNSDVRLIELSEGEAFFKVHHEPQRPFVVDTGELTVTAIGTAFNVRKVAENIAVSVTEGRTRVASPDGTAIEVGVGEQVVYDAESRTFKQAAVDARIATAWRSRRLEFVNEPLDVVIANLNRYVDVDIRMTDADAGRLTFTGTVMPENIAAWLRALPDVLPVAIEQSESEVRISRK